ANHEESAAARRRGGVPGRDRRGASRLGRLRSEPPHEPGGNGARGALRQPARHPPAADARRRAHPRAGLACRSRPGGADAAQGNPGGAAAAGDDGARDRGAPPPDRAGGQDRVDRDRRRHGADPSRM
ncbi:MAG: hypothetical protein AVDCRST_MAG89-4585, partial [uncultured Gemmatimonadetes bacterium]